MGMDVTVGDKDEDGSFSWMVWGKGASKVTQAERRGDALLSAGEIGLGKVKGRMAVGRGG